MIGIGELGKSVVMRRHFDAGVINLKLLEGLGVVINDHSAGTDDGHLAHLFRIEPAIVKEGTTALRESEIHHADVLDTTGDVAVALAGNTQRLIFEQMQNDRNIVGARSQATLMSFW